MILSLFDRGADNGGEASLDMFYSERNDENFQADRIGPVSPFFAREIRIRLPAQADRRDVGSNGSLMITHGTWSLGVTENVCLMEEIFNLQEIDLNSIRVVIAISSHRRSINLAGKGPKCRTSFKFGDAASGFPLP